MNTNHLDLTKISDGLLELAQPKINYLSSICKNTKNSFSLNSSSLPKKGGIYVFWWTGDKDLFKMKINRELVIAGPSKRNVKIQITNEWLNSFEDNICLYVGKNSSNIQKRIGQHIRLKSKRDYSTSEDIFKEKLKVTTGQLKRGIEELFLHESDIRKLILDNIGLSYYVIDGDENSVNRFYLEDKAIGTFYPIINVDIER